MCTVVYTILLYENVIPTDRTLHVLLYLYVSADVGKLKKNKKKYPQISATEYSRIYSGNNRGNGYTTISQEARELDFLGKSLVLFERRSKPYTIHNFWSKSCLQKVKKENPRNIVIKRIYFSLQNLKKYIFLKNQNSIYVIVCC